jgi:hypothetical protein
MYQIVSQLLDRLSADLRDLFEERAGITEFLGGISPREEAESFAMLDVLQSHPWAITGLTVIQIDINNDMHWILASDADGERLLARFGRCATYLDDPAEVIQQRFQGAALLCKWPADPADLADRGNNCILYENQEG